MISSHNSRFLAIAEERVDVADAQGFEPVPSFGKALFWNALLAAAILYGVILFVRLIGKL